MHNLRVGESLSGMKFSDVDLSNTNVLFDDLSSIDHRVLRDGGLWNL